MVAAKSKSSTLPKTAAQGKRFGIVVSRYHEELTQPMQEGAVEALQGLGAKKDDIQIIWVPGSFEIPLAARALLATSPDAVICLGVIVKGETTHDEYIARECAHGVAQLSQATGTPVIFGVLTTQTLEQAKARVGGDKGHKGIESAEAAVQMIRLLEEIKNAPKRSTKSVGF
jgi:6,7-dimethyl-8-ribityllumazine synthase